MDVVYFTGPYSPDGKSTMHCMVEKFDVNGLTLRKARNEPIIHYPARVVLRIEYGQNRY